MYRYIWDGTLVRLRAVEPSDWATFFDWNFDSDAARQSYNIPFPRSRERARRWAESEATQDPENDIFRFVVENVVGDLVGTLNTHSCDRRHGTFGYGLAIAQEYQRKGYGSEAVVLVLRYFFEELRYQKATVHVYSFNEPSIRLHERLGFQLEGRIRRMIYTEGQYFDDLIYGLTAEEFMAGFGSVRTLVESPPVDPALPASSETPV